MIKQSKMKSRKIIYICFLLPIFSACSDFLNQVPDDKITMEEVFQKKDASEKYLANVYSYIPDESEQWGNHPWTGNVDEVEVTWAKYPIYNVNNGNWGAGDVLFQTWGNYYKGIRSATYFINHIDGNTEILTNRGGQALIDRYKAEARFLRAYYYFLLMRQYGPVALIGDQELAPNVPAVDVQIVRSPFDDCVEYVVKELDDVAAILPLKPVVGTNEGGYIAGTDEGRPTIGAALALKSRLLLYAASPEYNGNTTLYNFKNQDGIPLISQVYSAEKWKRAADAAKAVIDLGIYQLYKDPTGDPVKSYRGILLTPWNSECIFVRKANNLSGAWDVHCSSRSAGGWNGIAPTQEMVDAYFMKDGKSISESSLYNETGFTYFSRTDSVYNMYINREPRFYASIQYTGMKYLGGKISKPTALQFFYTGLDGKGGLKGTSYRGDDYSHTGYLVYKNLSPYTNAASGNPTRPIVYFRLGEIYLNYAEALAEYGGNNGDALKYLNYIRERAGVPQYGVGANALPIPATKAKLIEKIRAERRIELAFECHRWFDVRRWKIVDKVMGDLHGMDINAFNPKDFFKRVVVANHKWKDAYYWWPVPQYEMDRATKFVQNPGW